MATSLAALVIVGSGAQWLSAQPLALLPLLVAKGLFASVVFVALYLTYRKISAT